VASKTWDDVGRRGVDMADECRSPLAGLGITGDAASSQRVSASVLEEDLHHGSRDDEMIELRLC